MQNKCYIFELDNDYIAHCAWQVFYCKSQKINAKLLTVATIIALLITIVCGRRDGCLLYFNCMTQTDI